MSTASRVVWETPGLPFSTRLTVASLTPTFLATSASRRVMTQLYGDCRKKLQRFATPSKSLSARSPGGLRCS